MDHHDGFITQSSEPQNNLDGQGGSVPSVFRLPIEVLEIIFIQYAHDCYRRGRGCPTRIVPSWVNVSYVCRHWRNVAMNCVTPWTYLFVTSQRWTDELLARSKQAPLKLYVNLNPSVQDDTLYQKGLCFIEELMNHMERIQELRLHLPDRYGGSVLFKLRSRAPRLQTLRVLAYSTFISSPSVLFQGDTPVLRELQLTDSPVPLKSFKLSGLTTLNLHGDLLQFEQDTAQFLVMLGGMQGLQRLYLRHVLASAVDFLSSRTFHTFKKINLPHLARFFVASPPSVIVALLSCATVPSKTELRLECCPEPRSESLDDYIPLCSLLKQRFDMCFDPTPSIPTIRSLVINFSDLGRTTLTFGSSEHDWGSSSSMSDQMEWDCNVILKISFHYSKQLTIPLMDQLTSDVCCSLPLTHVHAAHVIDPPFALTFWNKVQGHLRGLRYLKLSAGDVPDLTSVVLPIDPLFSDTMSRLGRSDLGPDVFAPALEELCRACSITD